MQGGAPGKPGRNFKINLDGTAVSLPGTCQLNVANGERIRLETLAVAAGKPVKSFER